MYRNWVVLDFSRWDLTLHLDLGAMTVGVDVEVLDRWWQIDLCLPFVVLSLCYWRHGLPKPDWDEEECYYSGGDSWVPDEQDVYCPECGCMLYQEDACSVCNWIDDASA